MTTICCVCQSKISGNGEPISHGMHQHCAMLIYPDLQRPVLMEPKATRIDCVECRLRDCDGDGVPDGCLQVTGQPCIATGRRSPWDL